MTAPLKSGQPLLFDLSARAKLRLTGADRVRFLNGQVTNDVRKPSESATIEACILSAKGKMQGHVFISSGPDCFFVDAEPELRGQLMQRLERYVIADDVQIEDLTDRMSIFHVLGERPANIGCDCRIVSARRFADAGWDVWSDSQMADAISNELARAARLMDDAAAEVFRIEQGIPRWGRELTEEIIPIEANLESRTVDYEKGCYIGQEVISRIKMSGQTNKRLCGLLSRSGEALAAGMKVVPPSALEKDAGWITSATRSRGREIALGYVRRGFNDAGATLEAIATGTTAGEHVPVEVVSLPFGVS